MRTLMSSLMGTAVLLAILLGLCPAPAFADPGVSQICSAAGDFGFSHGACVSILESNGQGGAFVASLCKELRQQRPEAFDAAFKNIGTCVSSIKSQFA